MHRWDEARVTLEKAEPLVATESDPADGLRSTELPVAKEKLQRDAGRLTDADHAE